MNLISEIIEYLQKAVVMINPYLVGAGTIINYILFPDKAYISAALALLITVLLDIVTKYYALQKPYGGFFKALKACAINSELLWAGTKKKLIGILSIMILSGLSYRFIPVEGIPIFISSIVYSVLFLREAQSVIENLLESGVDDLEWVLKLLKRKEKDILKEEDEEDVQ